MLRNPDCDYLKSPVLRLGYIVGNSIDIIAIVTIALLAALFLLWKVSSFFIRIALRICSILTSDKKNMKKTN